MSEPSASDRGRAPAPVTAPPASLRGRTGKTLLLLSQVFLPDPAAVGQHLADAAFEMARRGHRVIVLTSARGYDDPSVEYPAREALRGVEIRRLPLTSFGKTALASRVAATASFMAQGALGSLVLPRLDGILVSTSPPLVGVAASLVAGLRDVPLAYWAMDLNPDQLVALGKLRAGGAMAAALESANRFLLSRAALVVALDRYMADRLRPRMAGRSARGKLVVIPPWSHDDRLLGPASQPPSGRENPFRLEHGLAGKRVVMYSGNHSPSNPLRTLLEAARRLRDDDALRFVFVGGGQGKVEVEAFAREHALAGVRSLPYEPLERLGVSLSAADAHVVSLGDPMVGIIHPCKVYGAMAVGRPILYLGPARSHIGDLLDEAPFGWQVAHGDVDGAVRALLAIRAAPAAELEAMGARGAALHAARFGQGALVGKVACALEEALGF